MQGGCTGYGGVLVDYGVPIDTMGCHWILWDVSGYNGGIIGPQKVFANSMKCP
jgi:hypothetical protein